MGGGSDVDGGVEWEVVVVLMVVLWCGRWWWCGVGGDSGVDGCGVGGGGIVDGGGVGGGIDVDGGVEWEVVVVLMVVLWCGRW